MNRPNLQYFVEFFNILNIVICKFWEKRFLWVSLGTKSWMRMKTMELKILEWVCIFDMNWKNEESYCTLLLCYTRLNNVYDLYRWQSDKNNFKTEDWKFSFHKTKAFGLEFVKIWPHINLYSSLNGLSGLAFKTQGRGYGLYKERGVALSASNDEKKTLLAFLNRLVLDKL